MYVTCYQRIGGGSRLIMPPFYAKLIGETSGNRAVISVNGVEYKVHRAACSTEVSRQPSHKGVALHDPITGAVPRNKVSKEAKRVKA